MINSLPNYIFLDWTKLKVFADDKLNVANSLPNDKIIGWSKFKAFADNKINQQLSYIKKASCPVDN